MIPQFFAIDLVIVCWYRPRVKPSNHGTNITFGRLYDKRYIGKLIFSTDYQHLKITEAELCIYASVI